MVFAQEIINWYYQNKRELPWRNTTDPYVIWLSEVILQQTRVEQGLPYFNRFLHQYPTIEDSQFQVTSNASLDSLDVVFDQTDILDPTSRFDHNVCTYFSPSREGQHDVHPPTPNSSLRATLASMRNHGAGPSRLAGSGHREYMTQ